MGVIGWSPAEFWGATLIETFAAVEGLAEFHGGKPAPVPDKAKVDEMLLRFPDPPRGRRLG